MAQLIDASDALKRLMAAHDLTQAEVAEAARVTVATANKWVNARQRADAEKVVRAIRKLGDDPADYGIVLRKPIDDVDAGDFGDLLDAFEARIEAVAKRRHDETTQTLGKILARLERVNG